MSVENLNVLASHANFTHKVDWGIDPYDDTPIRSGTMFRPSNASYEYSDGFVATINTNDRLIELGRASAGDVDLNFSVNSSLLVAVNPDDVSQPNHAAIRILLPSGVRGVGAYVSGYRKGVSTQTEQDFFIAEMWVRLADSDAVLPCVSAGRNGYTRPEGQPPTAPFVGAESTVADIVEVSFDVSLYGNKRFDFVAISELWLIRS